MLSKFMQVTISLFMMILVSGIAASAEPTKVADLPYATVNGIELKLDLYRPGENARPGIIVWVHGGAWRGGSKKDMPLGSLVSAGYVVASVDYRLSPQAPFPAQVHDIKAAIRFLRAKQRDYGIDASRVVIAGASAGGHLAALVGVTNSHAELEGRVGEYLDQSSQVDAIVSFFGMSNLTTILSQSTPHGLKVRVPALQLLLEEITTRLKYLCDVGIGYLTLDRQSRTLSGGEVQRINLTTALGTSLVNTLFVLDEPSIGLHPRDMERVIGVMERLRDAGNSLVVVEHDPQIMGQADRLLDMGPGPGERGGEIVETSSAREQDGSARGPRLEHGGRRLELLPREAIREGVLGERLARG